MRTIAIDWSGAASGAGKTIWIAEASEGDLVRLENGRDRDAVGGWLIEQAQRDPEMIVGLDFAFALPAWFITSHGLTCAHELWELADRDAEMWLASNDGPFWGRTGSRRPELEAHFRRTEQETPHIGGIGAKSVFQIGGAGAVGTGSLRGMRLLHRLSNAGFSVWPFDPPTLPCLIEIYPRLLTGEVKKSNPAARVEYVQTHFVALHPHFATLAASSEDAVDATVSALAMDARRAKLAALSSNLPYDYWLEGRIWDPAAD